MKPAGSRTLMLALRAWLDEDDGEQNADRVVEYVVEQATAGHFGFFKLLLDMVDGKLHQTAEEELVFEAGCAPAASDSQFGCNERHAEAA
jgi:hypothetical protein